MSEFFAADQTPQVVTKDIHRQVDRVRQPHIAGYVRRYYAVLRGPERMVLRERLRVNHVDGSPGYPSFVGRVDESVLIDDYAALITQVVSESKAMRSLLRSPAVSGVPGTQSRSKSNSSRSITSSY